MVWASSAVQAQEAFSDALLPASDAAVPTSEFGATAGSPSAWLDLRQHANASSTTQNAPAWVQAVKLTAASDQNTGAPRTVFRIQLAQPPGDYRVLFFRLFFDDQPAARPEIVAWDESGSQVLRSGELGAGITLPSSESVLIPMHGVSLIDISVPGDGTTVRGAYLDWMTSGEVAHPLTAEHRDVIPEPFSAMPPLHSPGQDLEKFGTVTATLSAETIHVGADTQDSAVFEFGVETRPLLAVLTFEVASPQVDAPPQVYLNGEELGSVSLALPELADPGYRGETKGLTKQMRFRYTGWLRAQKIVPVDNVKVGTNSLVISSGGGAPIAIRSTQIQLKYLWEKSDYILLPTR